MRAVDAALNSGLPTTTSCAPTGRLSREKGVLELVEAWKDVQPANATLMLAGPDMPGSPWDAGPGALAASSRHMASRLPFAFSDRQTMLRRCCSIGRRRAAVALRSAGPGVH